MLYNIISHYNVDIIALPKYSLLINTNACINHRIPCFVIEFDRDAVNKTSAPNSTEICIN